MLKSIYKSILFTILKKSSNKLTHLSNKMFRRIENIRRYKEFEKDIKKTESDILFQVKSLKYFEVSTAS